MEPSIRSVTPGGEPRRAGRRRQSWARHRALVLGAVAVLAAALFGIAVAQTAEAGTVGAGSYADTLPAGRALPAGCGSLSTNPRQYVTANAPAGAVPTNDWWSSLLFKKFDCALQRAAARAPDLLRHARGRARVLLQHHRRDQRHARPASASSTTPTCRTSSSAWPG